MNIQSLCGDRVRLEVQDVGEHRGGLDVPVPRHFSGITMDKSYDGVGESVETLYTLPGCFQFDLLGSLNPALVCHHAALIGQYNYCEYVIISPALSTLFIQGERTGYK